VREIATEIGIAAPPQRVWEILMDFPAYADWNPFVTSIGGAPQVGERLEVSLTLPGGKVMGFRPTATVLDSERCFQWLGKIGIKGVFDGRHSFRLSASENGTHFEHSEQFTGVLQWMMSGKMRRRTEAGFRAMNDALKHRAES